MNGSTGQVKTKKQALEILELNNTEQDKLTIEQVTKQYRKLALIHHPDKNGGSEESTQKFALISEAHEFITKEKPDHINLEDIFGGAESVGADIFNDIFSFGNVMRAAKFAADKFKEKQFHTEEFNFNVYDQMPVTSSVSITLQQLYTGCTVTIPVIRNVKIGEQMMSFGNHHLVTPVYAQQEEHYTLEVPKGHNISKPIVFEKLIDDGQGSQVDLYLSIEVQKDTVFELDQNGLDLKTCVKLSLGEALCGCKKEIQHLDPNMLITIEFDPSERVPNTGDFKLYQGLGLKNCIKGKMNEDLGDGDLIVSIVVTMPEKIDKEDISRIKEIKSIWPKDD